MASDTMVDGSIDAGQRSEPDATGGNDDGSAVHGPRPRVSGNSRSGGPASVQR